MPSVQCIDNILETVGPWLRSAFTPEGKVGPKPESSVGPFGCDRTVPPGCCKRIFPLCSCATVYSYEGLSPLFCALLLMTCPLCSPFLAPVLHLIMFLFWAPPIHGIHYDNNGNSLEVDAKGVRQAVGAPIDATRHRAIEVCNSDEEEFIVANKV